MIEADPKKVAQANLFLALSTGFALVVLVLAAWVSAPVDMRWRPVIVAPAVVAAYLLINRFLLKRPPPTPLAQPGSPVTLLLAAFLPMILLACAAATILWPGHDFTLAAIVGGVLFGLTVESARSARVLSRS